MTGHSVIIDTREFKPQWNIRLSQTIQSIWDIDWIPIVKSVFGKWELPDEQQDNIFIVSHIVCQQNPNRKDLFIVWGKQLSDSWQVLWVSYLVLNPYYDW